MKKTTFENSQLLLCPVKHFMEIVGGKWKVSIICILSDGKSHRYGNIKKRLINITNTMLAQSLHQLEDHNIVERTQYNEIPPRVEYKLTPVGQSILPIVLEMHKWSINNSEVLKQNCSGVIFCNDCKK